MQATEIYLFAINIATMTLLGFNASLLIAKKGQNFGYASLACCFIAIAIVICQPSLKLLAPEWRKTQLIVSLPALLTIAPSFWFYIKSLTAESKWTLTKHERWHFALPLVGLFISLFTLVLPSGVQHGLLVDGDDVVLESVSPFLRYSVYTGLIITFLLVISWVVQSAFYVVKTIVRLNRYRAHLKDIFATTEQKEMGWLTALALLVGIPWGLFAVNLTLNNLLFPSDMYTPFSSLLLLIAVIFLATWSLRQKPGFEEIFDEIIKDDEPSALSKKQNKYKTSALTEDNLKHIADKLENAMQQKQLYLNAALSLPLLAKSINTSPNYISQTLNERLNVNFFDYVNGYRVKHAKNELTNSNKTVLDIAMDAGFNSKSAFYTAFKKYTGKTPVQYKQQSQS
ncbi:helix-turn-helix domain-containing protein [Pseudoalteromonas piratica]|uniref:HTH araC/xylS-type domain-containing protein n=1 Tax=Pseudoalteromonas piratica TaxID=1348114 RepID=A0A0A7EJ26_9GAMM|nr:AraC family transcriptional regulator [Pseudoalteromonas piratica]AIY66609.1 hypothetical protein OM33_15820 [Pseudoalteromonas piratica]